jgi:NADH-quinone oxidoreductase subunit I
MTSLFEMSVDNRSEAIFDKSVLVVNDDGTPNTHEEQTKLTNINDLHTSDGWMRATSPNGNPNFENIVNWSGSLGVGKKDPEKGQTLEEE